ncbi:MAG: LysR family transcriptional regulator [Polyangiaceae bacterium]
MLETEELRIFTSVVALSSISRAARELQVPRATVSRKLALLEERLGVRLLRRTTRSMQLTDAGRAFHASAEAALDAVRLAEASVLPRGATPTGDVFVSIPPMVGGSLPEVLSDFARQHPSIRLHVDVSNRTVDLARERFDVAIRATGRLDTGLTSRTLARVSLIGVAAQTYIGRHGTPSTVTELRDHRCLVGLDAEGRPQSHWTIGKKRRAVAGVAYSNDPHLVLRWALRGLGIALLPSTLVANHLTRGELVAILPGVLSTEGTVSLVMLERKLLPPAVRAFVDFVAKRGPAALQSPSAARDAG